MMKKILKRLFLTIGLLLCFLLSALMYFSFTTIGYKQLIALVNRLTPIELSYQELSGNLFNQDWDNFSLTIKDFKLDIEKLKFAISKKDLLKLKATIHYFNADKVAIYLPKTEEKKKEQKGFYLNILPKITAPIDLKLEQLSVNELALYDHTQKLLLQAGAKAQGSWIAEAVTLKGEVALTDSINQIDYTAKLDVAGDLKDSYPLAGRIHFTYPKQSMDLNLAGSLLSPNWQYQATGELNATASIKGRLDLAEQVVDLTLDVPEFSYGKDIVEVKNAHWQINGKLTQLSHQLTGWVRSATIVSGNVNLRGDTFLNGVEKKAIDFAQGFRWQADLNLDDVDLKEKNSGFQANLATRLKSKGELSAKKLSFDLNLLDINGHWQKLPVKGVLHLVFKDYTQIELNHLDVTIGDNQLKAKGDYAYQASHHRFNVATQMKLPRLNQLYPKLEGTASGDLYIKGDIGHQLANALDLNIKGKVKAQNLALQVVDIKDLDIDLDTGASQNANFNNTIELKDLIIHKTPYFKDISLKTQGKMEGHQIALKANGSMLNTDIAIQSSLNLAALRWKGEIQQLSLALSDKASSTWKLSQAAQFSLDPKQINMSDFCPQDNYSQLCLNLGTKAGTHALNYDIKKLDPKSFATFIPKSVRLNTFLHGKGKITFAPNFSLLQGENELSLNAGNVVLAFADTPPIQLKIQEALLHNRIARDSLDNHLVLKLSNIGEIESQTMIKNFASPSIQGALRVNIPNIGVFSYLIPEVSDLKGRISGEIQAQGKMHDAQIVGEINLSDGKLMVPRFATDLRHISLKLTSLERGAIGISGQIGTPQGSLRTNGQLVLYPLALDLNLSGNNLLLANAKKIRALATPQLNIHIAPQEGINIKGDVLLPEVTIDLPDISDAKQVSSDVVIVNNQTKNQREELKNKRKQSLPLTMALGIRLGNKVYFKNKDMNIRLKGGVDISLKPNDIVRGKGRIEVAKGVYAFYGQELDITRGWVTFGGDITNPNIDILALRNVGSVDAGAHLSGNAKNLRLKLTSNPAMPDSNILSYLLFGRPPSNAMDSEVLVQAAAVLGTQGIFPSNLSEKTGLDVFDLGISGLKAGKYLTESLYVGMQTNFFTAVTKFLARYQFSDRFSAEASSNDVGSGIDFIYEFDK